MCYTNFKVTGEIFPMLRVAMWCTMLGTNKHQDNIQRILTKADLDKLKTANAKEKVITAEHQLQGAWPIVAKSTVEDQNHSYKCFGRLCTRTTLFLVGKQKHSRESKSYEDLGQILEAFTQEMAKTHTCEAKEELESQTPQDVLSASAQDMALIQNPNMKPGEVHLDLCNVSFWLPICITPPGKSLNSQSLVHVLPVLGSPGTIARRTILVWSLSSPMSRTMPSQWCTGHI